ncbi:amino acid ABC transporter permease, partial [Rhizobium ruizarguesonis]
MDLSIMIPELLKALPLTLAITFTAMIAGFLLALIATTFRVCRIPV